MNHLIEMGILDNKSHLRNRCIHSIVDLLQDQIGLALSCLENRFQGTKYKGIGH